jgi:hypothetical protein
MRAARKCASFLKSAQRKAMEKSHEKSAVYLRCGGIVCNEHGAVLQPRLPTLQILQVNLALFA